MRKTYGFATATVMVLLAAALGCERAYDERPARATTTGAVGLTNDAAATRLAGARCDREVACNNVGADRKFATREACTREIGHDTRANLRAEECPRGIDDNRLSICLSDV